MRDGGKGDKPRPIPDRDKFEKNWDAIFNKKANEQFQDSMDKVKKVLKNLKELDDNRD